MHEVLIRIVLLQRQMLTETKNLTLKCITRLFGQWKVLQCWLRPWSLFCTCGGAFCSSLYVAGGCREFAIQGEGKKNCNSVKSACESSLIWVLSSSVFFSLVVSEDWRAGVFILDRLRCIKTLISVIKLFPPFHNSPWWLFSITQSGVFNKF